MMHKDIFALPAWTLNGSQVKRSNKRCQRLVNRQILHRQSHMGIASFTQSLRTTTVGSGPSLRQSRADMIILAAPRLFTGTCGQ
jgi:hypothetical protein